MTKTEQRIWREKTAVRIEEIAKQREFLETLHRLALQVADTVEAKLAELHARTGHEKAGAFDPVEAIHSAAVRSEQAMRVQSGIERLAVTTDGRCPECGERGLVGASASTIRNSAFCPKCEKWCVWLTGSEAVRYRKLHGSKPSEDGRTGR